MRTNVDYIRKYLDLTAKSDIQLFREYYKEDGDWLYGKWRRNEVVPFRLNKWCMGEVHRINVERRNQERKQTCNR